MADRTQFTGKLGLENRSSGTLSSAVSAVVNTLEEFGHPADTIEARAEDTAKLQCDHYCITVSLRNVPFRRSTKLSSDVRPPSDLLELTLSPVFPDYCDQEISELLLAEMLRRILPVVNASSVEWLDTNLALTCEQFLSVFETEPNIPEPAAVVAPKPKVTVRHRPRGRECFAPVDEMTPELEAHCDMAFQTVGEEYPTAVEPRFSVNPAYIARLNWQDQLRISVRNAFVMSNSRRLRFGSHLLFLTALILYLDSATMVQAALLLVP